MKFFDWEYIKQNEKISYNQNLSEKIVNSELLSIQSQKYNLKTSVRDIIQNIKNDSEYEVPMINDNISKIIREIFKFLIAQTSLREVDLPSYLESSQEFTSIPGVIGCLGNLSELSCNSDICSFFLSVI